MQRLINGIEKISDWSGKVSAWMIIPMILVIVYTVVMRYFFSRYPSWGFEIALFVYGIHFILGGAYTLKEKAHVNVDILLPLLPKGMKKILEIAGMIVILFVCVIIVWLGTKYSWQSTRILERSIHQTPFNPQIWWFKWFIPISAALVALQTIADILKQIIKTKTIGE